MGKEPSFRHIFTNEPSNFTDSLNEDWKNRNEDGRKEKKVIGMFGVMNPQTKLMKIEKIEKGWSVIIARK